VRWQQRPTSKGLEKKRKKDDRVETQSALVEQNFLLRSFPPGSLRSFRQKLDRECQSTGQRLVTLEYATAHL
jgi:hypothetical protein